MIKEEKLLKSLINPITQLFENVSSVKESLELDKYLKKGTKYRVTKENYELLKQLTIQYSNKAHEIITLQSKLDEALLGVDSHKKGTRVLSYEELDKLTRNYEQLYNDKTRTIWSLEGIAEKMESIIMSPLSSTGIDVITNDLLGRIIDVIDHE